MRSTKTAAEGNNPWENPWATDSGAQAANAQIGDDLRKGLLYGLAGGVGVGGLYYLSQMLKNKAKEVTHIPDAAELADAPITEALAPEPEEEPILPEIKLPKIPLPALGAQPQPMKAAFDKNMLIFPAVGAGAGALIGHARGTPGRKRRNALLGATLGAAGGLGVGAATSKPVWRAISEGIPRTYTDLMQMLGVQSDPSLPSETGLHGGIRNVMGLTLPAAGAYGGLVLADAAMQQDSGKKNRDTVRNARKEYFQALTGQPSQEENTEEKQSAAGASVVDKFLSDAFTAYQTTKSAESKPDQRTWVEFLSNPSWYNWITRPYTEGSSWLHGAMIAGGLGSGAIGAKYMYDKTKAQSAARNRERAMAVRERMRGLETPWVDPRELADVKALAAGGPAARGV